MYYTMYEILIENNIDDFIIIYHPNVEIIYLKLQHIVTF